MKWNSSLLLGCFLFCTLSVRSSYALSPPTILKAEPGDGQVTVTLSTVADASFYCVYYDFFSSVSNTEGNFIDLSCIQSPIVTISGLINGFEYWFVATVLDAEFNESGLSNKISATPQAPVTISYKVLRLDRTGGDILFGTSGKFCLEKTEGTAVSCIPLSKQVNDIKVAASGTLAGACADAKDIGIAEVTIKPENNTEVHIKPTSLGKQGVLCIKDPDGAYHVYSSPLRIVYDLSGKITGWQDRENSRVVGFDEVPLTQPLRLTLTEKESSKEHSGQMATDGSFSFPGLFETDVAFALTLQTRAPMGQAVTIQDPDTNQPWLLEVATYKDPSNPKRFDQKLPAITASNVGQYLFSLQGGGRAAFHILQKLFWGYQMAENPGLPDLTVRWKPGFASQTAGGETTSFYRNDIISLNSGDGDVDEWDASVILHEFGHFVMDQQRGGFPSGSGCSHRFTQDLDNRGCALSEAWADFYSALVLKTGGQNATTIRVFDGDTNTWKDVALRALPTHDALPRYTYYIDTVDELLGDLAVPQVFYNIETSMLYEVNDSKTALNVDTTHQDGPFPGYLGQSDRDDVEGAVASSLWDLYDGNNGDSEVRQIAIPFLGTFTINDDQVGKDQIGQIFPAANDSTTEGIAPDKADTFFEVIQNLLALDTSVSPTSLLATLAAHGIDYRGIRSLKPSNNPTFYVNADRTVLTTFGKLITWDYVYPSSIVTSQKLEISPSGPATPSLSTTDRAFRLQDFSPWQPGTYSFRLCIQVSGKTEEICSEERSFTVEEDATDPEPLELSFPSLFAFQSSNFYGVKFSAKDVGSGLQRLVLELTFKKSGAVITTANKTFLPDSTAGEEVDTLPDGTLVGCEKDFIDLSRQNCAVKIFPKDTTGKTADQLNNVQIFYALQLIDRVGNTGTQTPPSHQFTLIDTHPPVKIQATEITIRFFNKQKLKQLAGTLFVEVQDEESGLNPASRVFTLANTTTGQNQNDGITSSFDADTGRIDYEIPDALIDRLPDGRYEIQFHIEDQAGNALDAVLAEFVLDTTPPSSLQVTTGDKVYSPVFTPVFKAEDRVSGVQQFRYCLEAECAQDVAQWRTVGAVPEAPGSSVYVSEPAVKVSGWFGDQITLAVRAEDKAGNLSEPETVSLTISPSQRASQVFRADQGLDLRQGQTLRIVGTETRTSLFTGEVARTTILDQSFLVSSSEGVFLWNGVDSAGGLMPLSFEGKITEGDPPRTVLVERSYQLTQGGTVFPLTLSKDTQPPSPESLQLTLSPDTHPLGERALTIHLKSEEKNPWVRLFVERCLATTREECNREDAPVEVLAKLSDPFVLEQTGFVGFRDGELTTSWTPSQKEESFLRVRAQVADVAGNAIAKINVVGEETLFATLLPPDVQDFTDGLPIVANELALFGEASGTAFLNYSIAVAQGDTKSDEAFQVLLTSEEPVLLASKPLTLLDTRKLQNGLWTVRLRVEGTTFSKDAYLTLEVDNAWEVALTIEPPKGEVEGKPFVKNPAVLRARSLSGDDPEGPLGRFFQEELDPTFSASFPGRFPPFSQTDPEELRGDNPLLLLQDPPRRGACRVWRGEINHEVALDPLTQEGSIHWQLSEDPRNLNFVPSQFSVALVKVEGCIPGTRCRPFSQSFNMRQTQEIPYTNQEFGRALGPTEVSLHICDLGPGPVIQIARSLDQQAVAVVPAGALPAPVKLEVKAKSPQDADAPPDDAKVFASNIYTFLPEGLMFETPIRLRLHFREDALGRIQLPSGAWIDFIGLAVHHFNPVSNRWESLGGLRGEDETGSFLEVRVSHFSTFALLAKLVDREPPAAVTDLQALLLPDNSVQLLWSPVEDNVEVQRYRVLRAEVPITETNVAVVPQLAPNILPKQTSFLDQTAERGKTYYYAVLAVDAAGNESQVSNSPSVTLPLDETPPEISLSLSTLATHDRQNFTNDPKPTIQATLSDDLTGVDQKTLQLTLDGKALSFTFDEATGSLRATPSAPLLESEHTMVLSASDRAGNRATAQLFFAADFTPPAVVECTVAGLSCTREIFTNRAQPLIQALIKDQGSDVDLESVQMTLNGAPVGIKKELASVLVTFQPKTPLADGLYEVELTGKDFAGNRLSQRFAFFVDTVAPQVDAGKEAISNAPIKQEGSATDSDPSSGIQSIQWSQVSGPGTLTFEPQDALVTTISASSDGVYEAILSVQDRAGNEGRDTVTLPFDFTPPVTTLNIGDPKHFTETAKYISARTLLSLTATDPEVHGVASGVQEIRYSIDDAPPLVYDKPFTLPEGVHTLSFFAEDKVGNKEAAQTITLSVDATPPVTTLTLSGAQYKASSRLFIQAERTKITLSAQDPVSHLVASGVKEIRYRIKRDDGSCETPEGTETRCEELLPYTQPFTLTEGVKRVEYRAVDHVENTEILQSQDFHVDGTPPRTTVSIGQPQCTDPTTHALILSSKTDISVTVEDPVVQNVASGVQETLVKIGDQAVPLLNGKLQIPEGLADGNYTLTFYSKDRVENREEAKMLKVILDNTPPEITIASPLDNSLVNHTIAFVGTVEDTYWLDQGRWSLEHSNILKNVGMSLIAEGQDQKLAPADKEDVFAFFDTDTLPKGFHPFTLKAHDCVQNVSSTSITLKVGNPEFVRQWGRHGSGNGEFNQPMGIALLPEPSGEVKIFIADRLNHRVQVFQENGAFLSLFGQPQEQGNGKGQGKGQQKDPGKAEGAFNQPTGLTLTPALSQGERKILVADSLNHRIQVFDAQGNFIKAIGQKGSGPGSFNHPYGIALTTSTTSMLRTRRTRESRSWIKRETSCMKSRPSRQSVGPLVSTSLQGLR